VVIQTFRLTDESADRWVKFWRDFFDSLNNSGRFLGEVAIDFAHEQTIATFDAEGANGTLGMPRWTELAEWTLIERFQEGYEDGPILYRSGELMAGVTDEDHWNHVVERRQRRANMSVKIGTTDPRFERLQLGVAIDNLPPRPMWPRGAAEERFVRLLEEKLVRDTDYEFLKQRYSAGWVKVKSPLALPSPSGLLGSGGFGFGVP